MQQDQPQTDRRGRPLKPDTGAAPPALDPNVRREQERQELQQRRQVEREIQRRTEGERQGNEQQQREQQRRDRIERENTQQQQREAIERQQRERAQQQQQQRDLRDRRQPDRRDWDRDRRDRVDRGWRDDRWRGRTAPPPRHYYAYVDRRPILVVPERRRVYRNIIVLRPYGHWYPGYGRYYSDHDAYRWLGLTAITLGALAYLNESQQRALEHAQVLATTVPVGQPITWWEQGAGGSVVASRDGWSESGLYCREFQQTVEIGGRQEHAYGTACQQPDGSWQVTGD